MQEMEEVWVRALGREDPLEEGVATHSSILAWRIPWTQKAGGLQCMASQRVEHHQAHRGCAWGGQVQSLGPKEVERPAHGYLESEWQSQDYTSTSVLHSGAVFAASSLPARQQAGHSAFIPALHLPTGKMMNNRVCC